MKTLLLNFLALTFVTSSAAADVIVLNNGDRLTGTVDSISGGVVLLNTEYAGDLPIALDAIARMETEDKFFVESASGRIEGQFVADGEQQLLRTEAGDAPFVLNEITTAGQDNLSLTSFAPEWSSRADLAAKVSNGNSDVENYSALIEALYKKDNVEHSVSLLVANESSEDVQTKEELDLDYGYKRFISEHWYASGNAEYFEDPLKDLDSRITIGAGMGYQFWDDSFGSFSSDVGISYVKEELGGEDETNPAVRWGLDYKRYLMAKKLEAFHSQSILFIPDSDRGEVIESSTGLRYALSSKIDAVARIDLRHETKPSVGNSKTDVTYNLGIGIKF